MRVEEDSDRFILAVAGRHGGLGSTALAVDLALLFAGTGYETVLIDADASHPSAGARLDVTWGEASGVAGVQPEIDALRCQHCGACSDFCAFDALELHSDGIRQMPGKCNGCGGCKRVCPSHAISEKQRLLGTSRQGSAGSHLTIIEALLAPDARSWETATVAWLRRLMRAKQVQIVKAPPGLGRSARESLRGADRVLFLDDSGSQPVVPGIEPEHMLPVAARSGDIFPESPELATALAHSGRFLEPAGPWSYIVRDIFTRLLPLLPATGNHRT